MTLISRILPLPVSNVPGRLQRAFKTLVEFANSSRKICIFIDGLDEYEGKPKDIVEYVHEIAKLSPHAKFCMSVRPLPVFQSVLLGVPGSRGRSCSSVLLST